MPLLRLVVLDMAGTTVRDGGEVPAAFEAALFKHGISVTAEQLHAVRGSSKRHAVERFVPAGPGRAKRVRTVYAAFRDNLAAAYTASGVRAVPGAVEAIGAMRVRGIRVALNTGFDREITALLLNALQWSDGFVDAVVCGDDVAAGRPAPYLIFRAMEQTSTLSVREVMNVGDTVLDLEAGHNAAVGWNVGVLSGAHDRAALSRAPHTRLLASVADWESVIASDASGPGRASG